MTTYQVSNVPIVFKGATHKIVRREIHGRPQANLTHYVEVLILEDGTKILPAHFKYNFCKTDMRYINWRFSLSYSADLIRSAVYYENPLVRRIQKYHL